MPSRASARSPIYLYWAFVSQNLRPIFRPRKRRYHVARLTPRSAHGCRSVSEPAPTHHTGRHTSLAPTDKPAFPPPCGLFPEPALLMPLDAPACPVAAHRPPDAPNLSIGQGDGELSIQGARPDQQALVRAAQRQLAERREQMAVAPRCRGEIRRLRRPSPVGLLEGLREAITGRARAS